MQVKNMHGKCKDNRIVLMRLLAVTLVVSVVFSICSCFRNDTDFDGVRFANTRHITVAVDSMKWKELYSEKFTSDTDFSNSTVAGFIHDQVLLECNIDIKFVNVNDCYISNGTAADVMYLDNINMINVYYRMGSIIDLKPYLEKYEESLSDLFSLLGDDIYYCDATGSEVWYLPTCDLEPDAGVTFIRKDWLDKLGLEAPETRVEFHNCLTAFRDNADLLLGDEASSMIPFFVDSEPNVSAKPLLDSCLDTDINDKDFYVSGYCRTTQEGYMEGLEVLNSWYLEGLLPDDFSNIRPDTKEAYEPIENGYVGAFCAKYDYLYKNGVDSIISSLHEKCGNDATYIAVNTFENAYGNYTYWHEDYLDNNSTKVFVPATCSDPLACLVYLNWISNESHITEIQNISKSNPDDPFTYERYLLTCQCPFPNGEEFDDAEAEAARQKALEVEYINRGSKCVSIGPRYFDIFYMESDFASVYPGSTEVFVSNVITAPQGEFDTVFKDSYTEYLKDCGAFTICIFRQKQYEQVVERGDLSTW